MNKDLEIRLKVLLVEFTSVQFKVNCRDKKELAEYIEQNGVDDIYDDLHTFALLIQKANLLNLDIVSDEK